MELNRWKELICVFLNHRWEKRTASLLDGIFVSQFLNRFVCERCGLERTKLETAEASWITWARKGGKRSGPVMDRIGAIVYGIDFATRFPAPTVNSERRKHKIPPVPGSGLLKCGFCGEETNDIHEH